ncbi:hypothetical protein ABZW30_25040 [Kitasatospora sp. NPDC004669]|uniref:hypothetical protein n=1 Tax=Kitasatospora sp. NPDC004669 TaxID=3154555 RepID=UPI00339DC131
MIVDCAHYRAGRRQHEGPIPLEEAAARCTQGGFVRRGFVRLGMFEPTPEELARVRASFGLHELAVEDAQTFHLRPKAEQEDSLWVRETLDRISRVFGARIDLGPDGMLDLRWT